MNLHQSQRRGGGVFLSQPPVFGFDPPPASPWPACQRMQVHSYLRQRLLGFPIAVLQELHYNMVGGGIASAAVLLGYHCCATLLLPPFPTLHKQISLGKVFCQKQFPNCKACPLSSSCEYAHASELGAKRRPRSSQPAPQVHDCLGAARTRSRPQAPSPQFWLPRLSWLLPVSPSPCPDTPHGQLPELGPDGRPLHWKAAARMALEKYREERWSDVDLDDLVAAALARRRPRALESRRRRRATKLAALAAMLPPPPPLRLMHGSEAMVVAGKQAAEEGSADVEMLTVQAQAGQEQAEKMVSEQPSARRGHLRAPDPSGGSGGDSQQFEPTGSISSPAALQLEEVAKEQSMEEEGSSPPAAIAELAGGMDTARPGALGTRAAPGAAPGAAAGAPPVGGPELLEEEQEEEEETAAECERIEPLGQALAEAQRQLMAEAGAPGGGRVAAMRQHCLALSLQILEVGGTGECSAAGLRARYRQASAGRRCCLPYLPIFARASLHMRACCLLFDAFPRPCSPGTAGAPASP